MASLLVVLADPERLAQFLALLDLGVGKLVHLVALEVLAQGAWAALEFLLHFVEETEAKTERNVDRRARVRDWDRDDEDTKMDRDGDRRDRGRDSYQHS